MGKYFWILNTDQHRYSTLTAWTALNFAEIPFVCWDISGTNVTQPNSYDLPVLYGCIFTRVFRRLLHTELFGKRSAPIIFSSLFCRETLNTVQEGISTVWWLKILAFHDNKSGFHPHFSFFRRSGMIKWIVISLFLWWFYSSVK